tara:strand:- start:143 stop:2410 length:2268 start_codon:yes stop_codon:yes gene_type:complete
MQRFKNFIINRVVGLIFLTFFCFSFLSLLSKSTNDPYSGFFSSNEKLNNLFGTLGGYFSGITFTILGLSSFLIPAFFLILGFKKIFGIKTNLLLLRLCLFILAITLLSTLLSFWLFNGGILGGFLFEVFTSELEYLLINQFIFFIIFFVLHFVTFFLLIFGLSINFKIVNRFFYPIFIAIMFVVKLFKLNYLIKLYNILKKINLKNRITNENNKYIKNNDYNIKKKRTEPTIEKNHYKKLDVSQLDASPHSSRKHFNEYTIPPLTLLSSLKTKNDNYKITNKQNEIKAHQLENILKEYGVIGEVTSFKRGPVITLFEFQPSAGVKTSKVVGLATDIARSMSSMSARISSQPGKNSIGIEIPNEKREAVYLRDLLQDDKFTASQKGLTLALGKNIAGEKIYTDLENMPHLLIAGTTGSGKSVGINSMLISLLFKFRPSECKFILIDPKMLELSVYENIPHLLTPVVTDPKKAVFTLKWVVREMENRYRKMNIAGVKNIQSFNKKITNYLSSGKKLFREVQTGIDSNTKIPIIEKQEMALEHMPLIVVIIDEMADLMMVAGKEVEHSIQRLAQMARASGIHLIAATQRPSVDVITGTIKANFPSRISYRVASKFDSRTILNEMGAEQLLGSGDMLFLNNGASLVRLHGGYISENEIQKIVGFINSQSTNEIQKDITNVIISNKNELDFDEVTSNFDELYHKAVSIIIKHQRASTSFLQRHLQIGYNRAARIIEHMEKEGIISEANHVGKRNVLKKNI